MRCFHNSSLDSMSPTVKCHVNTYHGLAYRINSSALQLSTAPIVSITLSLQGLGFRSAVTPLQSAQPLRDLRSGCFRPRLSLAGAHSLQLPKKPRLLQDSGEGEYVFGSTNLDMVEAISARDPFTRLPNGRFGWDELKSACPGQRPYTQKEKLYGDGTDTHQSRRLNLHLIRPHSRSIAVLLILLHTLFVSLLYDDTLPTPRLPSKRAALTSVNAIMFSKRRKSCAMSAPARSVMR